MTDNRPTITAKHRQIAAIAANDRLHIAREGARIETSCSCIRFITGVLSSVPLERNR